MARAFALGGGIVFVASLGYFLYAYDVRFAARSTGSYVVTPILWNLLLFSAFALHHSIFARGSVRTWVARTWGRFERSAYVWAASVLLFLVCLLWLPVPGVLWDVSGPFAWALRGVQLIGIWLSVRSAAIINIWDLSGIAPVAAGGPQASGDQIKEFKIVGPYALVRHPIYLGWFLIVFGVPRMTMTQLVFAVVSCVYVLIAIPFEERSLLTTSGDAYRRYMHRVRWKLMPYVY